MSKLPNNSSDHTVNTEEIQLQSHVLAQDKRRKVVAAAFVGLAMLLTATLFITRMTPVSAANQNTLSEQSTSNTLMTATFGGGCFWCMEPPFDKTPGVKSTTSGYTGGAIENPTYRQVSAGGSGHVEVVQVQFDPAVVDYATLLDIYWKNVDPLTANQQFCDAGSQYRSAIFVDGDEQATLAIASLEQLKKDAGFKTPIVTEILNASTFWPAEDYHQDYYKKNPVRYKLYRTACGRDRRLNEVWGGSST